MKKKITITEYGLNISGIKKYKLLFVICSRCGGMFELGKVCQKKDNNWCLNCNSVISGKGQKAN